MAKNDQFLTQKKYAAGGVGPLPFKSSVSDFIIKESSVEGAPARTPRLAGQTKKSFQ
jgi:hypothetical protein